MADAGGLVVGGQNRGNGYVCSSRARGARSAVGAHLVDALRLVGAAVLHADPDLPLRALFRQRRRRQRTRRASLVGLRRRHRRHPHRRRQSVSRCLCRRTRPAQAVDRPVLGCACRSHDVAVDRDPRRADVYDLSGAARLHRRYRVRRIYRRFHQRHHAQPRTAGRARPPLRSWLGVRILRRPRQPVPRRRAARPHGRYGQDDVRARPAGRARYRGARG